MAMTEPSGRSRTENRRQGRARAAAQRQGVPVPAEKKHKNMAQVRATGRQGDPGGSPGAGPRRSRER